MAPKSLTLILILFLLSFTISSTNGRKLLTDARRHNFPALDGTLLLAALPKGTVPSSAPSKKGHAVVDTEKLVARHLAAVHRILRSVPSPGVGH